VCERERERSERSEAGSGGSQGAGAIFALLDFFIFSEEIAAASPYLEAIHAELVAHVLWSGQATLLALCGR
jgi:hypothetical protein